MRPRKTTARPTVGFIGLGTMGTPMALNLLQAGFPLVVWNRTTSKTGPLKAARATVAASPSAVAAASDITITMLAQPHDVEEVVLAARGVLAGLQPGSVLVDMSTVSPATSRKLAAAVLTKQGEFLDAPVVGSKGPATAGTLVILVGGLSQTLDRCRPVLSAMGKTIVHAGGFGTGSSLKLATNLMLAHLAIGFAEALLLVQRAGIGPTKYLDVLQASTFHSPWYQTKGAGMIQRDFSPHFALKHMRKDLRLMGQLAADVRIALPVTEAIEQMFAQAESAGLSEQDYSAILGYLEGVQG